jgi:hypothetical protein
MTQLVVDAATRNKLQGLKQPLELCNEAGKVLARLIPVLDKSEYEAVEAPITAEELARRRGEPDFSTAEVLAHLEKL